MVTVLLETASAKDVERFDDSISVAWNTVASARAETEFQAKAIILDDLIALLNNEDLLLHNSWLRLSYYNNNGLSEVEVF